MTKTKSQIISEIYSTIMVGNGEMRATHHDPARVHELNIELLELYFDDYDDKTRERAERTIENLLNRIEEQNK